MLQCLVDGMLAAHPGAFLAVQNIPEFLKSFSGEVDISEALEPIESFKTFNQVRFPFGSIRDIPICLFGQGERPSVLEISCIFSVCFFQHRISVASAVCATRSHTSLLYPSLSHPSSPSCWS